MADVLLIEPDPSTGSIIERTLQAVGHVVWTTPSGVEGLEFLAVRSVDAVIVTLQLHDMQALDLIRDLRSRLKLEIPAIITTNGNVNEVLAAIRLGATDFIGKPISEARLHSVLDTALAATRRDPPPGPAEDGFTPQPHAATRWAKAVVPIVDCPTDPRTISGWGRCIAASPGAIRNWCFTAGIGPRRSLVFGRLLRVVVLSEGGRHKPENLLDVVDRRTLFGLLRLGGFDKQQLFPAHPHEFLERQIVVRDTEALLQVEEALNEREANLATTITRRTAAREARRW